VTLLALIGICHTTAVQVLFTVSVNGVQASILWELGSGETERMLERNGNVGAGVGTGVGPMVGLRDGGAGVGLDVF
jgi:hypothetical protein